MSVMNETEGSQATRLRDVVTDDHVRKMLKTEQGSDACLVSWKIRDFTEDDNNLSCFVVSVDVKYTEGGIEQSTCYALKVDLCDLSEIFEDLEQDFPAEETVVDSTSGTGVHFSLGSLEDCRVDVTIEAISDVHVKSALDNDRGESVRLISWDIPASSRKGDAVTSHFVSVDVIFRGKNSIQNTSYVVKYNPNSHRKPTTALPKVLFSNEINTYLNIVPTLNSVLQAVGVDSLRLPRCFYASEKSGKELMFFEDLRLRGFRNCNEWRGMDNDHAILVLKELARLHASSILLQKRNPEGALCMELNTLNIKSPGSTPRAHVRRLLSKGIELALEILGDKEGYEKAVSWLTKHKPCFHAVLERMLQRSPPFDVVCHGICWDNNTLFRYDEEDRPLESMLINFQWSRMASVATDLSSLLLSARLKGGSEARKTLLAVYFRALEKVLEAAGETAPFPLEELLQEYKSKQLFGMIFALVCIPLAEQVDEGVFNVQEESGRMMENVARRLGRAAEEEEEEEEEEDEEEEEEEEEKEQEDDEEDEREEEVDDGEVKACGERKRESLSLLQGNLLSKRIVVLFDALEEEGLLDMDISEEGH